MLLESWLDPILTLTRLDPPGAGPVMRSDLIRHLAALLGEDHPPPRLGKDALPVGLDALLAPALFQRGADGPVHIDGRGVVVMSLSGKHEAYDPAPLERVQDFDMPLIWICRYNAMSRQTALKQGPLDTEDAAPGGSQPAGQYRRQWRRYPQPVRRPHGGAHRRDRGPHRSG